MPHTTRRYSCPCTQAQLALSQVSHSQVDPGRPRRGCSRSPSPHHSHHSHCRSSSRPRHRSRSRSPAGATHRFQAKPRGCEEGFQQGASGLAFPACAICLGCHKHNVRECCPDTLANGKYLTVSARNEGRLTLKDSDRSLCADWQSADGCSSKRHDERHLCSGCASPNHGAQVCPRGRQD